MKTKIFLILFVTLFTFIAFKSHTQAPVTTEPFKFKVCVTVTPEDNTQLDERLETFIRRELRALGDVVLVPLDSDWHFRLAYNHLELKTKGGTKTGELSIAEARMSAYPRIDYKTYGFPGYGKPAMLDGVFPAYWPADDLHGYAIQAIGDFDKSSLERLRPK